MGNYGDHILLRHLKRGRLSMVVPATLVEDSADLIAFYVATNTPIKLQVAQDGSEILQSLPYADRFGRPWKLGDRSWRGNSVLWLSRPNLPYMIGAFWDEPGHRFGGLYCNLQDPLRRNHLGFDTADHVLDVQFWPDGSWNWKDEDEFDDAQRVGHVSSDEAAYVREIGEKVIRHWQRKSWPFDQDWSAWIPDTSWTVPSLPIDWDRLF